MMEKWNDGTFKLKLLTSDFLLATGNCQLPTANFLLRFALHAMRFALCAWQNRRIKKKPSVKPGAFL